MTGWSGTPMSTSGGRSMAIDARALAAAVTLAAGIAAGSDAVAAPQVLGLTASNAPIPLTCHDDSCSAIAGTFCLQQERPIPTYGARYEATRPEQLALALLGSDGKVIRIAGGPWIEFTAYSGYTMVHLSVPRGVLAAYDATAAAVEIGAGVSLVPLAQSDDGNPQSPDEIALATGPMRAAATHYLDQPSLDVDAARLVATLVNALPEGRTIHDDYSGLWDKAMTDRVTGSVSGEAVTRAAEAYDKCRDMPDLRHCLIARHRELMTDDNKQFWTESAGY